VAVDRCSLNFIGSWSWSGAELQPYGKLHAALFWGLLVKWKSVNVTESVHEGQIELSCLTKLEAVMFFVSESGKMGRHRGWRTGWSTAKRSASHLGTHRIDQTHPFVRFIHVSLCLLKSGFYFHQPHVYRSSTNQNLHRQNPRCNDRDQTPIPSLFNPSIVTTIAAMKREISRRKRQKFQSPFCNPRPGCRW